MRIVWIVTFMRVTKGTRRKGGVIDKGARCWIPRWKMGRWIVAGRWRKQRVAQRALDLPTFFGTHVLNQRVVVGSRAKVFKILAKTASLGS
jgi:hypothetical protein